jgi:hypothetical protein
MKMIRWAVLIVILGTLTASIFLYQPILTYLKNNASISPEEMNRTDRPDLAAEQNYLMTRDPNTLNIPSERLIAAYDYALTRGNIPANRISWEERGPVNIGGRTRAIMWDPNDPTHRKFWAGAVSGGLWYTDDILANPVSWEKIDDFWDNIAISSICYDPTNTQVFYVGTGEGWFMDDNFKGFGIWKSSDGGNSWNHLPHTSGNDFRYIQKMVADPTTGDLYIATRDNGVMRTTDGGIGWQYCLTTFTAPGFSLSTEAADLEIMANGKILASLGLMWGTSDGIYISDSGTPGSWSRLNTGGNGFPTVAEKIRRIELAIAPSDSNIVYALVQDSTRNIKGAYKSIDGGQNWDSLAVPMNGSETFTKNQAWYDLIAAVHPTNPDIVYFGGVTLHLSENGGSSWRKIAGIHADHHAIAFRPGSPSEIAFGNDGGVYYTDDGTANRVPIYDKNYGYNVTQFYSCALDPLSGSNYILGGTQDNGTLKFKYPGLNEVTGAVGGDGGYCFIKQNDPRYQIVSYIHSNYYLSTDFGENWAKIVDDDRGWFINPCDYDDQADVLYACSADTNTIIRIDEVTDHHWSMLLWDLGFNARATQIKVSPFSDNIIFAGTESGRIYKITHAHSSNWQVTDITGPTMPVGPHVWVSCIELGTNEDQILVTYSNYSVSSVWETTDGGAIWVNIEGNLPDMPVRWAVYNPLDYRQVLLATELGVWFCEDITASIRIWDPANEGLANVRVDMLQLRKSDYQILAATHGRGMYSTNAFAVTQATKLRAWDGSEGDNFGKAVGTNGDYTLVGSDYQDEKGEDAGALYFFENRGDGRWDEEAKVLAPDGEAGDRFGYGLDMDGNYAIVAAPGDADNGPWTGSAYIYHFSANSWALQDKITGSNVQSEDRFGVGVALYGDFAAAGAYTDDLGTGSGSVFMFQRNGNDWIETQQVFSGDPALSSSFGHSVDIYGDFMIVGDPFAENSGASTGSAHIYHYNDTSWVMQQKITASDGTVGDKFGHSVAIYGEWVVVAANGDDALVTNGGAAYVFHFNGGSWIDHGKLTPLDIWEHFRFGEKVSIFGDYIIVTAPGDWQNQAWGGSAYIFRKDGSNWVRQNKIFPVDGTLHDLFGMSAFMFGNYVIVGSIHDDDNGEESGSAYIFDNFSNNSNLPILSVTPGSQGVSAAGDLATFNISNNGPSDMAWTAYAEAPWLSFVGDSSGLNNGMITVQVDPNSYCARTAEVIIRAPGAVHSPRIVEIDQDAGPGVGEVKITATPMQTHEYYGFDVDIDGEFAIVGAYGDSEFGAQTGAAYIYEREGCSWVARAKLTHNTPENGDYLGWSVAISGDIALVSAPGRFRAYIFEKPPGGWRDTTETAELSSYQWGAINVKSVDISGDYAIVGGDNEIFFFERPLSGWADMTETAGFDNYPNHGFFGEDVAIDGNLAVVGARNDASQPGGTAYIYKRDWYWGRQGQLIPSDWQSGMEFGMSVDISGERVIVGAPTGFNGRSAYIFEYEDFAWQQEQKLQPNPPALSYVFGRSVAIYRDYALVGDYFSRDSVFNGGAAFAFKRDASGWYQTKRIFSSDLEEDDHFGFGLGISGPYAIIGAYGKTDSTSGLFAGAAYLYCTESDLMVPIVKKQTVDIPQDYQLSQNYPNPLFNVLGEEIATLLSASLPSGSHRVEWNAAQYASGVYLYRLRAGDPSQGAGQGYMETRKMILMK